MKKTIFSASLLLFSALAFAGEPDAKVMTAFQKRYPQATEVHWFSEGANCTAYFIERGITHNLSYDKKGNLLSCIRYYGEKDLPVSVRGNLRAQFNGLSVYGVTEITIEGETIYEIHLQNAKLMVTVTSNSSGELVETARYERAR